MMPRSDATLNIQLASTPSGKLYGVPSGMLMKEESTRESPAEHAVSGSGLQHLHHYSPGSGGSSQGGLKVNLPGSSGGTGGGFTRNSAVSPSAGVQASGSPFNPPILLSNSPGGSARGAPTSTIGSLGGSPPESVSGRSVSGATKLGAMDDVDIEDGKKSDVISGGSKYMKEPQNSMFTSLRQI